MFKSQKVQRQFQNVKEVDDGLEQIINNYIKQNVKNHPLPEAPTKYDPDKEKDVFDPDKAAEILMEKANKLKELMHDTLEDLNNYVPPEPLNEDSILIKCFFKTELEEGLQSFEGKTLEETKKNMNQENGLFRYNTIKNGSDPIKQEQFLKQNYSPEALIKKLNEEGQRQKLRDDCYNDIISQLSDLSAHESTGYGTVCTNNKPQTGKGVTV